MKTSKKQILMLSILLGLLFSSNILLAQDSNNEQPNLVLNGQYHDQKVYLRWLPNRDIFEIAKSNGFTLTRYETPTDTSQAAMIASLNSRQIIFTGATISDLQQYANSPDPNKKAIFDAMHYNPKNDTLDFNQLADAVQYTRKKEFKYIFTMMMVDQNFQFSLDLNLGFLDTTIINGKSYHYYISMIVPTDSSIVSASAFVTIPTNGIDSLEQITELAGEGGNKKATISWNIRDIANSYTYFDVYRSEDNGSTFTKRNESPFTMFSQEGSDDIYAFYPDSLPQNNFTYIYKVKGRSPFGFEGPFSDTVHVKGIPDPLDVELKLDTFLFNNEQLTIGWNKLPQAYTDSFTQFRVYYRPSMDQAPMLATTNALASSAREFTFVNAPSSAYYFLEANDVYGRIYQSVNYLAQTKDSIPPATPTGITGFISRSGDVTIEWEANTEPDLDGYLVYYSNGFNGAYTVINNRVTKSTTLHTTINPEFNLDSIYFSLVAVDQRFNRSPYSAPLALQRPDVTGPSQPIITQLIPTPDGIRVGWRLSEDTDVKYQVLQRRRANSSTWNVIEKMDPSLIYELPAVPQEEHRSNFLDDGDLVLAPYQYRILAEDFSGNQSSSNIYTVVPYDDGIRGQISDLMVHFVQQQLVWSPNGLGSGTGPSGQVIKVDGIAGRLHWQYQTDFPSSLQSFKIYRKSPINFSDVSGSNDFILIKTIPATEAAQNAQVQGLGSGYAMYDTLLPSKTSGQVKYKVISYHSDGGQSNWTNEVILIMH